MGAWSDWGRGHLARMRGEDLHYVKRCLKCKTVIEQCRCPDPNKAQLWDTCNKCRGACEE